MTGPDDRLADLAGTRGAPRDPSAWPEGEQVAEHYRACYGAPALREAADEWAEPAGDPDAGLSPALQALVAEAREQGYRRGSADGRAVAERRFDAAIDLAIEELRAHVRPGPTRDAVEAALRAIATAATPDPPPPTPGDGPTPAPAGGPTEEITQ